MASFPAAIVWICVCARPCLPGVRQHGKNRVIIPYKYIGNITKRNPLQNLFVCTNGFPWISYMSRREWPTQSFGRQSQHLPSTPFGCILCGTSRLLVHASATFLPERPCRGGPSLIVVSNRSVNIADDAALIFNSGVSIAGGAVLVVGGGIDITDNVVHVCKPAAAGI